MSEKDDDIPDLTRRRLLKMASYVPAGIVVLSAVRSSTARAAVTAGVKTASAAAASSAVKAAAKAF